MSQFTLRSCEFALLTGEDRWDDSGTTSQLQMSGDGTGEDVLEFWEISIDETTPIGVSRCIKTHPNHPQPKNRKMKLTLAFSCHKIILPSWIVCSCHFHKNTMKLHDGLLLSFFFYRVFGNTILGLFHYFDQI